MAITKLNSLAIPPDTVVESDISFPLDSASFTGDLTVDTDTLVVDSTNNRVGIGDTAPNVKLKIKGGAGTIEPQVTIESTAFNAGQGTALNFSRAGFDQPIQARISAVDNGAAGSNFIFSTKVDGTAGALTERMRIDGTSGNVGIGGTPESRLDVRNSAVSGNAAVTVEGYGGITGSINSGAGTGGTFISTQDTATLGLSFGVHGARNTSGHFDNPVIKMVLDTDGNLLVGTSGYVDFKQRVQQTANYGVCALVNTLSSGLTYDQFQILVQNAASSGFFFQRFYAAGGTQQFGVTGNGVIYAQNTSVQSISDARVKENVRDSEQGLDVITALRPVRFDFKEGFGNDQKNQLGFIAQEVESVFPDAVMEASEKLEGKEPLKSLGPAALIPVMVKAIQEQQAIIETLQAQVAELQGAN